MIFNKEIKGAISVKNCFLSIFLEIIWEKFLPFYMMIEGNRGYNLSDIISRKIFIRVLNSYCMYRFENCMTPSFCLMQTDILYDQDSSSKDHSKYKYTATSAQV